VGLFSHYEAGHLWAGGGIGDQPARYLEAMGLLAGEIGRHRRKKAQPPAAGTPAAEYRNTGRARLKVRGLSPAARRTRLT